MVYNLARRVGCGSGFMFWFGGSSSLISWHENFSVRDTRSDTSMVEVCSSLGSDCEKKRGKRVVGEGGLTAEDKKKGRKWWGKG